MPLTRIKSLGITDGTITAADLATGVGGKVLQVVQSSDATLYSISIPDATTDVAGSIAYSITPSSTSSKIIIHFTIPQFRQNNGTGGIRIRLYRQIGGGGYSHVTALSGTASSNKLGSLAGNYSGNNANEDANRTRSFSGSIVDSPNTTSAVDYKFYFGTGDGADTVYINRTINDTDSTYTSRTRTHVILMEI